MNAVGILLVGGAGTRLYPATYSTSKQLLPVYDKPMFYYPLTTLLDAGVRDIMVISQSEFLPAYKKHLGNGHLFGCTISYAVQDEPKGIADAITVAHENHLFDTGAKTVVLALGDNIFHGAALADILSTDIRMSIDDSTCAIYLSQVLDPERYGVAVLDGEGNLEDIIEKPHEPPSDWAVTGLYVYPVNTVVNAVAHLRPSDRGELEITDLNRHYLQQGLVEAVKLPAEVAWLDTGNPEALLSASQYVHAIQTRQGSLIGSPHEAAVRNGFVEARVVRKYLVRMVHSPYSRQLLRKLNDTEIAKRQNTGVD